MRAAVQDRYGSPELLEVREVDRPTPREGEVRVRVRAASLHPDVWHVVTGRPYLLRLMGAGLLRPVPSIPGTDMAGTVEAVGARVRRFRPGDVVFGETVASHVWTHGGACAEYVCAPQDGLAPKPPNVPWPVAAAAPTAGSIALLNFRHAHRVEAGHRVLINGAAGGVGSIALQLAKARGMHVTAVDAPHKRDMLRELGADEVVDYTREGFTRRGVRYRLVFDVPGSRPFREVRRVLEPDGLYVPIGHDHYGAAGRRVLGILPHFVGLMVRTRFTPQLRGERRAAPARQETMARLAELLAAGTIRPVVARSYPLAEIRAAFRHLADGAPCGRIVVEP